MSPILAVIAKATVGVAGKVAVFGLLERHGKVCAVVVPNCGKETLMAKIRAHAVKGAVFYTDSKLSGLGKLRQTSADASTRPPSRKARATLTALKVFGVTPSNYSSNATVCDRKIFHSI
jgi:hypothetical protein